jgi:hypothetical protein
MSVGDDFAYSTKTSKYRSSSKIPVSISSYSGSKRPRRRFFSMRSVLGVSVLLIFIEVPHMRMGRRRIEIIVVFLDVFAVVAFGVGQSEQPLLEDRILAVPIGRARSRGAACRR